MRLTPEREAEIKANVRDGHAGIKGGNIIIELLDEIDILKYHLGITMHNRDVAFDLCKETQEKLDDVLKERDQLRIELQASLTLTEASIRIKNEIEEAYERITKLNYELSTDLVNREAVIGHLKDSIAKLKEDMTNASSSP